MFFFYVHPSPCILLLLSEALRLLDRIVQLLDELLVRLVRRQIEPIEAGVRSRQPRVLAHLLDAVALRSVRAHQLGKAADRHATRARHELQQTGALLVVRFAHKLVFGHGGKGFRITMDWYISGIFPR